jgi:hypothetical protein
VTPEARAAVLEMPPVPPVTTFDHPKDNWVWTHCENKHHKPQQEWPAPNREIISEDNPLEVDVFYSIRDTMTKSAAPFMMIYP